MPSVSADLEMAGDVMPEAPSSVGGADTVLPEGLSVRVRVPASSANLGPGFDCLAIALGVYDELTVETTASGIQIDAVGEGAADIPRDERHLVARAVRRGLEYGGASARGLALRCVNAIPHSRGLGSSAAAAVSGFAAASGLLAAAGVRAPFTDAELVQLAGEFEGHPDNAAASVLGGAVVTWTDSPLEANPDGVVATGDVYLARRLEVHPDIRATVFVPETESSTSHTRGLLPDSVPRTDAVFNLSRSALTVVALTTAPECLVDATVDRLHQPYRAPSMPQTAELVAALRKRGYAAMVSGAGPSVLILGALPVTDDVVALAHGIGFATWPVDVAQGVEISW